MGSRGSVRLLRDAAVGGCERGPLRRSLSGLPPELRGGAAASCIPGGAFGDASHRMCAIAFVADLGSILTGMPATAPHRKAVLRHGPVACGAGPLAFCFLGACARRANPSVCVAGFPCWSAVLTFCLFDVTYVAWFTQFAGVADTIEAVCVSSMLHGESCFRKPQPANAALIWFAGIPVACCGRENHVFGARTDKELSPPDRATQCVGNHFCTRRDGPFSRIPAGVFVLRSLYPSGDSDAVSDIVTLRHRSPNTFAPIGWLHSHPVLRPVLANIPGIASWCCPWRARATSVLPLRYGLWSVRRFGHCTSYAPHGHFYAWFQCTLHSDFSRFFNIFWFF